MGNHHSGSDLISGELSEGVNFSYSDIYSWSDKFRLIGRPHYERWRNFMGGIFVFNSPKNDFGELYIIPKTGIFIADFEAKFDAKNYDEVETDNIEFNKLFTVYACSAEEAFYLLPPQVLESIIQLHKAHKQDFMIEISSNKLYFIVPGLNLFEPPNALLFDLEMYKSSIKRTFNDFVQVAEVFRLNKKF